MEFVVIKFTSTDKELVFNFNDDFLKKNSKASDTLYEDSIFRFDSNDFINFFELQDKIKIKELTKDQKRKGFYELKVLKNPPLKKPNKVNQYNTDDLISHRNSVSELAIPFFKKNIYHPKLSHKDFQKKGINWLKEGKSKILADDMGLGKTLQAISASAELIKEKKITNVLIICPSALCSNWAFEINKWLPYFSVIQINNAGKSKNQIWNKLFNFSHFMITNYEQLRKMPEILHKNPIDLIIADEAHKIRKGSSEIYNSISKLTYSRFWALSGTPIEKDEDDIAHLLKIIDPEVNLPVLKKLDNFSLKVTLKKYLLRRMKVDVLDELVEIEEIRHEIDLSDDQKKSYKKILESEEIKNRKQSLKIFSSLKAICDLDPHSKSSSKIEYIEELCEKIFKREEKCVIFSFWLDPLYKLNEILNKKFGKQSNKLFVGSLDAKDRENVLSTFKSSKNCFILLCSGKLGGEGLNLTEANHVIFFNKWWNPSNNDQARDRIYRIGQEKKCFIHSLITIDSVESRVDEILSEKDKISDEIIESFLKNEIKDI